MVQRSSLARGASITQLGEFVARRVREGSRTLSELQGAPDSAAPDPHQAKVARVRGELAHLATKRVKWRFVRKGFDLMQRIGFLGLDGDLNLRLMQRGSHFVRGGADQFHEQVGRTAISWQSRP